MMKRFAAFTHSWKRMRLISRARTSSIRSSVGCSQQLYCATAAPHASEPCHLISGYPHSCLIS
jgi:hypothetical protein